MLLTPRSLFFNKNISPTQLKTSFMVNAGCPGHLIAAFSCVGKTDEVKKLPAARGLLFGTRLDKKQIDKLLIAIVFSQNNICPGHVHLEELADCVPRGVAENGGTGIKMNIGVGSCDGIALGHEGMKYSLPSRKINRDCIIDIFIRCIENLLQTILQWLVSEAEWKKRKANWQRIEK